MFIHIFNWKKLPLINPNCGTSIFGLNQQSSATYAMKTMPSRYCHTELPSVWVGLWALLGQTSSGRTMRCFSLGSNHRMKLSQIFVSIFFFANFFVGAESRCLIIIISSKSIFALLLEGICCHKTTTTSSVILWLEPGTTCVIPWANQFDLVLLIWSDQWLCDYHQAPKATCVPQIRFLLD